MYGVCGDSRVISFGGWVNSDGEEKEEKWVVVAMKKGLYR